MFQCKICHIGFLFQFQQLVEYLVHGLTLWTDERVIGCLRQKYTILDGTLPIAFLTTSENNPVPLIDKIVRVCSALINHCPSIISFD